MFKEVISRRLFCLFAAVALLGSLLGAGGDSRKQVSADFKPRLRRPVALALAEDGRWLFVANERAGSISLIDTATTQAVLELAIGKRLVDLAVTPDGRHLLTVDEEANELVLLSRRGQSLKVLQRLSVSAAPVSVCVTGDGSRCYVASLWSRQLSVVELKPEARVQRALALPFAPRCQLLVNRDSKLIVADSFGGRLAVLDVQRGEVESVRTLPAHNIRGLALSRDGQGLLITHQILNGLAQTTFDDVHWGNLITNNLRILELAMVLAPQTDLLKGSRLHYLGDVGNAAADPAQVAVSADGKVAITLAGVGDVALGHEQDYRWKRLSVGRRPTAVVIAPHNDRAYVANHFADSVTVIDLPNERASAEISLGPQSEPGPTDRGEMLFYDARLAHDGWLSCHSCHTDGHTNGLLNDNLGDGSFGAPKRVLSLLGVGDTSPYAWLGSMPDLETQIHKSILATMHGRKPGDQQVKDLAAFLRTLPPPPALINSAARPDHAAVERGREIFHQQACARCHAPPEYTSGKAYDVGLHDEVGNTRFNPPSLRGVSQGGPYFHDNRAATLEEVIAKYRHQLKGELSKQEREDLLSFLRSL